MMLKVLIIDDEPYVREGLKHIIDWQENGFEICGEASDGDEGYSKILELKFGSSTSTIVSARSNETKANSNISLSSLKASNSLLKSLLESLHFLYQT